MSNHILKRAGHIEVFDDKKLKMSIFAACLNAHLSDEESDIIADKVVLKIKEWIYAQPSDVTSESIHKLVEAELKNLNEAAALMYNTHKPKS